MNASQATPSMRHVPFVDAHVHLWNLAHLRYPWLMPPFDDAGPNGCVAPIAQTYLPQDYRTEASAWNVAGYVHVEAGADPGDALAETEWLSDLADGPTAIVAHAPLDDPSVEDLLDAHAAHGKVRGVRHIVNWHAIAERSYTSRDVTLDPQWEEGFALLGQKGLSLDLQAYPGQFERLARIFGRHPATAVIVNHLGMPVISDAGWREEWSHGLSQLAMLPNVYLKISGFGFVRRPWTADEARPLILEAIDIFSPQRICVASDFPTDRLFGSFDATLGAYAAIIEAFSEGDKQAMWGGNAGRFYRLQI